MSLSLEWSNEQAEFDISKEWMEMLEQLLQLAAEEEGMEAGIVSLSFVDDEMIQQLNKDYRNMNRPTDVLSFAMREFVGEIDMNVQSAVDQLDQPELLGDIIISLQHAKAQSEQYEHSFLREIGFLFVHGFLHLVGYDHQDAASEEAMFTKQEKILLKAGLTR